MNESQLQAWLDQEDELVAQTIREHGLFIQSVGGGFGRNGPQSFAYTVGLFGLGHPELVVCGVGIQTAGGRDQGPGTPSAMSH
jgi:hypothetical protein